LTKSAPLEFPIVIEDSVILAKNLSRDKALKTHKVNKPIPTSNREKKSSLRDEDNSSKEISTTGKIMNNPNVERKSEQHNNLCGSPNFTNSHGLLNSSPIDLNFKYNNSGKHLKINSDTNNQFLNREFGLAEGESKAFSEHFPKESQSDHPLSNISEKRKFNNIKLLIHKLANFQFCMTHHPN